MTKFRVIKRLDPYADYDSQSDLILEFQNNEMQWEHICVFETKKQAKEFAEKFAAGYEEEIFSI